METKPKPHDLPKIGRPRKYKDPKEIEQIFEAYLEEAQKRMYYRAETIKVGKLAGQIVNVPVKAPLSLVAFTLFAGMEYKTFLEYENEKSSVNVENEKAFTQVCTRIRKFIEDEQGGGAVAGVYNANIVARMLGIGEKIDIEQVSEKPLQIIIGKK